MSPSIFFVLTIAVSGLKVLAYPLTYAPIEESFYTGIAPLPFYRHPLQQSHVAGGHIVGDRDYYEENTGNRDIAHRELAEETLRNGKQITKHGGKGHAGEHFALKEDGGSHEHGHVAEGVAYGKNVNGKQGGEKIHDSTAKTGFQGLGKKGHKKGHQTTGFHNSYHNVESGKNTKFIDEDHNFGEENFGEDFDNFYNDKAWNEYDEGISRGAYKEKSAGSAKAREETKSTASQGSNWNSKDHTGRVNNRDLAFQKKHSQGIKNSRGGIGQTAVKGKAEAVDYVKPEYW